MGFDSFKGDHFCTMDGNCSPLCFFVCLFVSVTAHNIPGHFYSTVEWPYFIFALQIHELFLPMEFTLCISVGNT